MTPDEAEEKLQADAKLYMQGYLKGQEMERERCIKILKDSTIESDEVYDVIQKMRDSQEGQPRV